MNYIKATLYLISISFLSSCIKSVPIDEFDSDVQNVDIIVEGFVATDIVNPTVKLTKPIEFAEWGKGKGIRKVDPVAGATVTLSDGTNTVDLTEHGDLKGYYTTDVEFNGEVGKTYTLTIVHNGKTYTASDKLVAASKFDKTRFPFGGKEIGDTNTIDIRKHNFGFRKPSISVFEYGTPFRKTTKDSNGKYVDEYFPISGVRNHPEDWDEYTNPLSPFYNERISEDSSFPTWPIKIVYAHTNIRLDASFSFEGDERISTSNFRGDYKINIYQFSVSDAYYRYLLASFSETEWLGLLSPLPANLPTNLSEGALGYFWATDLKKTTYEAKDISAELVGIDEQ